MSNNKKYIVVPGGKECKLVNPNQQFLSLFKGDFNFNKLNHEWVQFEDNNPTYALTEVMPEGVEFEGEIQHQYDVNEGDGWLNCDEVFYNAMIRHGEKYPGAVKTRIAIKPLKTIEPVNVVEKKEERMDIIDRQKCSVDNGSGGDHVSEYFVKVAKKYNGNPLVEVKHYENSNDRLSILKIDDKTVASVIETRTEFNHVEFVFAELPTPAAVDELDLEERAEMWLQSEYGSTINESPITGHAYIVGWKEGDQQKQDKVVELIEGVIEKYKNPILADYPLAKGMANCVIGELTDLLTKIKE